VHSVLNGLLAFGQYWRYLCRTGCVLAGLVSFGHGLVSFFRAGVVRARTGNIQ
jgi:hypothetical protein